MVSLDIEIAKKYSPQKIEVEMNALQESPENPKFLGWSAEFVSDRYLNLNDEKICV
jgi:hypothetical protein